ncbi:RcpC/CpaB family pilus assembly protein [Streptomyces cremeus]|uniref:RcpC/CpaB family pilus assembly protein n=1 Tax=Streptomyces cremeus TaxID=66881 RepID=A0ABV5PAC7_STRCM
MLAVGLAVSAAALAAATSAPTERAGSPPQAVDDTGQQQRRAAVRPEVVSAPVRIADAATVRLLRPGDRVDVIASANSPISGGGSAARVVAAGVRVAEVPDPGQTSADGGALVVLSVPRPTATQLAGAAGTSRLVVTLC